MRRLFIWSSQSYPALMVPAQAAIVRTRFARYHLVIGGHSAVVAGASFIDIHFWLPAYAVIIAGWVAAAIRRAGARCSGCPG